MSFLIIERQYENNVYLKIHYALKECSVKVVYKNKESNLTYKATIPFESLNTILPLFLLKKEIAFKNFVDCVEEYLK